MKKIDKHLAIISIIFFIMSILNFIDVISLESYGVFGLTFGSLFICISTCFSDSIVMPILKNLNISKIITNLFYFLGWIFIVISVYIKPNDIFDKFLTTFSSNTLLLLSLGFTFLSLLVSDIKQKKIKKESDLISERLNKLKEEELKTKQTLDDLLKRLKRNTKGDSNE